MMGRSPRITAGAGGRQAVPVVVFLLAFWLMVSSLPHTSATYDEHEYIARGYTYLQSGRTDLKLRHPILLDVLAALPLRLLDGLQLPLEHPSLAANDFHVYARIFMWEQNGDQALRIIRLARLPAIGLTLLLLAAVYRWTRERFGLTAAAVAVILAGFDPNLLAHGRLVTPDAGQTTLIFLATFAFWRYQQRPGLPRLLIAGLLLGLAQTAGYPALILYPLFLAIGGLDLWHRRHVAAGGRQFAGHYAALVLLSGLTIWAVYGFRWGPLPGLSTAGPAPYYWAEFLDLLARLGRQDLAYLNGEVYRGGRPSFFIVGLLVKTPLPTLILSGLGLAYLLRRRTFRRDAVLWLVPAVYYGAALGSSLNIGYRHILPILPFLYVWGGSAAAFARRRWQPAVTAGLLLWLIAAAAQIQPFFLTYFNELAGGPDGGRRFLVVSDLDWGQDLPALRRFLEAEGIERPFLSYFGTAPPERYGIDYWPLPAWPPRGIPGQLPFHPRYPLPGIYAISAANLMGARFEDNPDLFGWFREREPLARPGNSIYVYRVPQLLDTGRTPVRWVSAGVPLDVLPDAFVESELGTNDIAPGWFDSASALLLPDGRAIIHLAAGQPVDPDLAAGLLARLPPAVTLTTSDGRATHYYATDDAAQVIRDFLSEGEETAVYAGPEPPANLDDARPRSWPIPFETTVSLLGWQLATPVTPGETLKTITIWHFASPPAGPLAIFVHLMDAGGTILAQDDRLDANGDFLREGDTLVQVHRLAVPADLPSGELWLATGIYRTDTLNRIPLPGDRGDRLFMPVHGP